MIRAFGWQLPTGESHLQEHLANGETFAGRGSYQLDKLQMVVGLLPQERRRTAVDVGAHIGLWSFPLSFMFRRVMAFEPVPDFHPLWHANMEGRGMLADLYPYALGPETGHLRIAMAPENTGSTHPLPLSSQDALIREGERVITCPMRTLDSYTPPDVDLIKVDCEGGEEGVLMGARQTILWYAPVVIVEQKRDHSELAGYTRLGAVRFLEAEGYRVHTILSGDFIMVPPWHQDWKGLATPWAPLKPWKLPQAPAA